MVEKNLSLFYGHTAIDVKKDEIKENDDETGWKHKTPIYFHLTQCISESTLCKIKKKREKNSSKHLLLQNISM
jgi:hypothetical protein